MVKGMDMDDWMLYKRICYTLSQQPLERTEEVWSHVWAGKGTACLWVAWFSKENYKKLPDVFSIWCLVYLEQYIILKILL